MVPHRLLPALLPHRRLAVRALEEAAPSIDPAAGAERAETFADFAALAVRDDVPGAPQVQAVKFLMTGVDGPTPRLYLVQGARFAYHFDFATGALGVDLSLETFNSVTYFRDERRFLAGTIVHHESFVAADGTRGLFALEHWPTDPVRAPHVALAFHALAAALPFAVGRLAYHPAGSTQEALLADDAAALAAAGVRTIGTAELLAGVTYTPMNLGVAFGVLRILAPGSGAARPPTVRDIVVLEQTPNDLPRVAGIVTTAPQTPLSHVNLKAKQDHTPNAYRAGAVTDPELVALRDRIVRLEVAPDRLLVTAADPDEAAAFLARLRPATPQVPPRDLSRTEPAPLGELRFGDAAVYGAKATNVAELRRALPSELVPDGWALPFAFYDRFMEETGLYAVARETLAAPGFAEDVEVRDAALARLRRRIRRATMPAALADRIHDVYGRLLAAHGPFQPVRYRSSTNNEDLPGWNGAGLYDSYTHRPDEGDPSSTVQQVFASLWNLRAFDERELQRVDHFAVAMGVLIHPNEDHERANGVAYTRNLYDPSWPGFYLNVQVGESLVTNPDPGARPEELLVSRIGPHGEYETQYVSRSTLVPPGVHVLDLDVIERLVAVMEVVQPHFARLYGRAGDPTFAMDLEFKIRADRSLQIKQARPAPA